MRKEVQWESSVVQELREELGMSEEFAGDLLLSYRNIARVTLEKRDDEAPSPAKAAKGTPRLEPQRTVTATATGDSVFTESEAPQPMGSEDRPSTPKERPMVMVRRVIIDDILKAAKITSGEALFAKRLFNFVDVDGSESLDFREFVVALYGFLALERNQDREVFLQYIFEVYDQDASDSIDSSELRTMVSDMVGFDTRAFLNSGAEGATSHSIRKANCLGCIWCERSPREMERVWAAQANMVNEVMRRIKTELFPTGKLSISCDDFVKFFSAQRNMSHLRPILELQNALRAEYLGNKRWRTASEVRRTRRQREENMEGHADEPALACADAESVNKGTLTGRRFSKSEEYLKSQTIFHLAQQRGEANKQHVSVPSSLLLGIPKRGSSTSMMRNSRATVANSRSQHNGLSATSSRQSSAPGDHAPNAANPRSTEENPEGVEIGGDHDSPPTTELRGAVVTKTEVEVEAL